MMKVKSWIVILIVGSIIHAQNPGNDYPLIEITPNNVEIVVGDTIQLQVIYKESNGSGIDTTATWSVEPDSIGTVATTGLFTALLPGECLITAVLDTLNDSILAEVIIEEDEDDDFFNQLVILPADTLVTLGAQVQYAAYYVDSTGSMQDTTVTWGMAGMPIGQITTGGLLDVDQVGYAIITAETGNLRACSFVITADSTVDSSGTNTIVITRDSPNPGGFSVMDSVSEGGFWSIGGLPYPMNILNGGLVYFPYGSIIEDIRIHISLPGFATPGPNGVNFDSPGVVAGVDFQVMVNDTVIEPYYFESPLITGLVFKRGLLNNLGIDPTTLGLYFAMEVGDSIVFDTTGIGDTMVDSTSNRIFSTVVHFSTLAVKGETSTVSTDSRVLVALDYQLLPNYPNPFNPTTTIQYELPQRADVQITIYDLLGRKVTTLVSATQDAGYKSVIWNATNDQGQSVSAGMYFYQIKAGDFIQTRKMILLK